MMRRPPRSTRTDTHFLAATLVRSVVEASGDAAVRGIRDKDDRLAAARVRDAIKVADATQRADSSAIDKLHARVMQALLARIAASAAAFDQVGARDRKSAGWGRSVAVSVDTGGLRLLQKNKHRPTHDRPK